jgi:integrase
MAKRRGNNEGSITKRTDGRWMGRYTVQTATGAKRRVFYGKKTRGEASEKLTAALATRNGGMVFDDENLNVGEYLERWLNKSVRGSVRESTHDSYRRLARGYIIPAMGRVRLKKLTPMRVQAMYRDMQDRGLSPRTVQYTHTVLHRALKQALGWGMIPRNVCEAVDRPQIQRKEAQSLDSRQAKSSWTRPVARGTAWKPSTSWPCVPGCAPESC